MPSPACRRGPAGVALPRQQREGPPQRGSPCLGVYARGRRPPQDGARPRPTPGPPTEVPEGSLTQGAQVRSQGCGGGHGAPSPCVGVPPSFPTDKTAEPQDRLMGKSHLPLQRDAWAGGSPPTPGPRQAPRCARSMQCGPHSMCSHVHSRGDRRSVRPIGSRARRWRVGPGASCCTPHVVGAGHRAQQRPDFRPVGHLSPISLSAVRVQLTRVPVGKGLVTSPGRRAWCRGHSGRQPRAWREGGGEEGRGHGGNRRGPVQHRGQHRVVSGVLAARRLVCCFLGGHRVADGIRRES